MVQTIEEKLAAIKSAQVANAERLFNEIVKFVGEEVEKALDAKATELGNADPQALYCKGLRVVINLRDQFPDLSITRLEELKKLGFDVGEKCSTEYGIGFYEKDFESPNELLRLFKDYIW